MSSYHLQAAKGMQHTTMSVLHQESHVMLLALHEELRLCHAI